MADNATVVDDDRIRTDDGREIDGLAREIATLGVEPGDRVEYIEEHGRLVQHTD